MLRWNADALKLYVILDPVLCGGGREMVETALAAAAGGATLFQLRTPQWKKRAMAECARELLRALRPLGIPLIIDDHADVAAAVGADGLHVGQADLSPEDARKVIGPQAILGLSVGSMEEAKLAPKLGVDYWGVGPVFTTTSKPDAGEAIGLEGLTALARAATVPIVAIGGINRTNARSTIECGARGVAVISAVCGQPDPEDAARTLLTIIES